VNVTVPAPSPRAATLSTLDLVGVEYEVLVLKATAELCRTKYLERVMGIEPTSSAWEAEVLPLNYTRNTDAARRFYNHKLPRAMLIGAGDSGGQFSGLRATNVTDKLYIEGAGPSVLYGDPRVVGVRARMDFN
jgi:hypothetical protein